MQSSGDSRRGIAEVCRHTINRHRAAKADASQYSSSDVEMMDPHLSRGVLDTPHARGMTRHWRGEFVQRS